MALRRTIAAEQPVDITVNNCIQPRSFPMLSKLLGVIRTCWRVALASVNKAILVCRAPDKSR